MTHTLFTPLTIVCILVTIPLSTATNTPIVDVKISIERNYTAVTDIIIINSGQSDIYLTGLEYSISEPIASSAREEWEMPRLLKANESYIHRSKESNIFYSGSSTNVTVSGSLFIKTSSNSFVLPFSKTATFEAAGANKSISPNITDIKLKVSRLTDENGNVKMIIAKTNISIYNPNFVAFYLTKLNFQGIAMFKEDENFRILKPLPIGCFCFIQIIIMPMDTYVYSFENTISDNDTIQYFTSEEPKYIKIKGSAFLIPNETGWSPAYFEPSFNTLITITNGSVAGGNVVSTPTPTPESTSIQMPTPKKNVSGFELIFAILGMFAVSFLLKTRS